MDQQPGEGGEDVMTFHRLSDRDVLASVRLLKEVPATMSEPAAGALRKMLDAASSMANNMSAVLAIWPDGTFAMLLHNPQWMAPRPAQLLRTYDRAYASGIRMRAPLAGAQDQEVA